MHYHLFPLHHLTSYTRVKVDGRGNSFVVESKLQTTMRTVNRRSLPKPGIVSTQKTTTDSSMMTTDHRATRRAATELSGYSINSHSALLYRFTGRGFAYKHQVRLCCYDKRPAASVRE